MIYNKAYLVTNSDKTAVLLPIPQLSKPLMGVFEYMVKQGDTLFSIANKEFRDTDLWYDIALLNPVLEDTVVLIPGSTLKLPNYG